MRLSKLLIFFLPIFPVLALAQNPPYVHTQPAGPITSTNANLNGMVVPNGSETLAWFEWGTNNSYGQLTDPISTGTGTSIVRVGAVITNLSAAQTFWCRLVASNAAGVVHGFPILFATGQRVRAWGLGDFGATNVPANLNSVVSMAGADSHGLAVKTDGTVVAWGRNDLGQTNVPFGLSNVVFVSGGYGHSIAMKSDGTVAAWGQNNYGQTNIPSSLSNVVAIASGNNHSIALKSNGTVVGWGNNGWGESTVSSVLSNVVAITAGASFSVVLRANGTVVAWGINSSGQTNVPAGLTNVVAISAKNQNCAALRSDGTVVIWGSSSFGATNVPIGLSNIVAVARGALHTFVSKSDGRVLVWGSNSGVTNVPPGYNSLAGIAAGSYHSLALGNNLPPLAFAQTNTGVGTNDLTIALLGSDANGDILNYRIASLPTIGTLFQWNSGVRGPAIVAPDTAVTDSGGRIFFAPQLNGTGWPYSFFTYTANDPDTNSPTAVVTVNVIPKLAINTDSLSMNSLEGFSFRFEGFSNAPYRVWASSNLVDWAVVGVATQSATNWFSFADSAGTNSPCRFYRVSCP